MTTPLNSGVRTVLLLLALPLGGLGLGGLALGMSIGDPAWALVGLVAALHALTLARVWAATAHRADDAARAQGTAGLIEPWLGLLAASGGLWGLLAPTTSAEPVSWVALGLLGVGGVVAFVGGRYAADTPDLPEGAALGRWARLTVWAVVWVAADQLLGFVGPVIRAMHGLVFFLGIEILIGTRHHDRPTAPLRGADPPVLRWVFQRWNPLTSLGEAVQSNLGVDLRTTWAIQFLRAAVEPMVVGVALLGWLCTSLVRVGPRGSGDP